MCGVAAASLGGWVLAAVVSLAGGCGDDRRPVNESPPATESGPPTLDASKLQLQQRPEGVRLVGRAGAVLPGAGAVTVTNAETGNVASASVDADGSLAVLAPGDRDSELDIDVDGDGMSDGRIPSLVDAAFAADGECNCGTALVSYIDGADDDLAWGIPTMPLGCFCTGDCQLAEQVPGSNLDGYIASVCSEPDPFAVRISGCGLTTVVPPGFLVGGSLTFDAASGELRGATRYSDAPWGKCAEGAGAGWSAFDYVYGEALVFPEDANELTVPCASTTTCLLCGASDSIPACD